MNPNRYRFGQPFWIFRGCATNAIILLNRFSKGIINSVTHLTSHLKYRRWSVSLDFKTDIEATNAHPNTIKSISNHDL